MIAEKKTNNFLEGNVALRLCLQNDIMRLELADRSVNISDLALFSEMSCSG